MNTLSRKPVGVYTQGIQVMYIWIQVYMHMHMHVCIY